MIINWYNNQHRHSAIGYVTPSQRRADEDKEILNSRKKVYIAAQKSHPERWSGTIRKWDYVEEVKLNPSSKKTGQKNAA